MATCKRIILKKFEKNQDRLATLDSNFLLGKTKRTIYVKRRAVLRREFQSLKKRYNKC